MKGKRTLVVEIPADEVRVAILEGLLDLTRPKNASASDAWADMQERSPAVAEMADRAATNVMLVVARFASQGRTVQ